MSEGDVLLWLLLGLCAGGIGGAVVGGLILWARTKLPTAVLSGLGGRFEVPVDVRLRAAPVALKVAVEQPEAVTVPIVTTAAPSVRELAGRVIGAWPEVGPTDLATICGCSKSTAHAILQDAKAGKLPTAVDVSGEQGVPGVGDVPGEQAGSEPIRPVFFRKNGRVVE